VIGDAGEDLFTYPQDDSHSERPPANARRDEIIDLRAPSGAPFIHHALTRLFGAEANINFKLLCKLRDDISSIAKNESTVDPLSLMLTQFKAPAKGKDASGKRVRIDEYRALEKYDENKCTNQLHLDTIKKPSGILVIHDACPLNGWSTHSNKQLLRKQQTLLEAFRSDAAADTDMRILVNLKDLPQVDDASAMTPSGQGSTYPRFQSQLWRRLVGFRKSIGIIVSLATLRRAGVMIRHGLSWEQTVEDFTAELQLFRRLRALSQFRHLFIRIDREGLIHLRNDYPEAGCRLKGTLYFEPFATNPNLQGHIVGKNTFLIACLIDQLCHHAGNACGNQKKRNVIADGVQQAIIAARLASEHGYDITNLNVPDGAERPNRWNNGKKLIDTLLRQNDRSLLEVAQAKLDKNEIVAVDIPEFVLSGPRPDGVRPIKRWHILDDTIEKAPIHRINIAVAVVRAGFAPVLNRRWHTSVTGSESRELWEILTRVETWNPRDRAPDFVTLPDGYAYLPAMPPRSREGMPVIKGWHENPDGFHLYMPVVQYGKQVAVERDQIESFRGVENLLREYLGDETRNKKPVSIAVFAPPGAGKSFAIKEIAKELGLGGEPLEYNIAQFQGPGDLHRALHEVTERSKRETSLVFFDEFDSACGDQELGWLKFFLAPMQDGAFYSAQVERPIDIGRAVFIFAGGIYSSFERFDPRSADADEELGYVLSESHKKRIEQFKQAKGPDFISRLRGYINIAEANAEPGRAKHFARRAIQLLGLLERLEFVSGKWARIDEPIIYAMLTVDRYQHGVRSMEAILRMCRPIDDYIRISSLPARAQLNMHVDAEEFFIRLHRGRSRMEEAISTRVRKRIDSLVKPGDGGTIAARLGTIIDTWKENLQRDYMAEDPARFDAKLELVEKLLEDTEGIGKGDDENHGPNGPTASQSIVPQNSGR